MKKLSLTILFTCGFLFAATASAQATSPPATVLDVALNNPGFSTLVAAVQRAGLSATLSGPGPFTVFAPTDAAFAATLANLGISAEQLLARDDLAAILAYHVVRGNLLAVDVITAVNNAGGRLQVETVNGAPLTITLVGGNVRINGVATVVTTDLVAGNGVVHVINGVLLPPPGSSKGSFVPLRLATLLGSR